jgi:hypothetical protein
MMVFGLLVALSTGPSAVQASNMAMKMATSQHMAASGADICGHCADQQGGAKKMTCEATCVAPAAATLPQFLSMTLGRAADYPSWRSAKLSGLTASPDPAPPRSIDLV